MTKNQLRPKWLGGLASGDGSPPCGPVSSPEESGAKHWRGNLGARPPEAGVFFISDTFNLEANCNGIRKNEADTSITTQQVVCQFNELAYHFVKWYRSGQMEYPPPLTRAIIRPHRSTALASADYCYKI